MIHIDICVGSSCSLCGSDELALELVRLVEKEHLEEVVTISGSFCRETCFNAQGVSVRVGEREYRGVQPAEAEAFFYREIESRIRNRRFRANRTGSL